MERTDEKLTLLARGTHSLIQGMYDVRIDAPGHDELAQLARDFNTLAATLGATARRASNESRTSPTSFARRSR
jgi:two-component system sensor histidine kinase BaeS